MHAIIFCGLQGSGKSTFYFRRFADTHVRLNLDMLRTRNREDILLHACFAAQQPVVINNTNPLPQQRRRYAALARAAGFVVDGFFFETAIDECLARNAGRSESARVPDLAIRGTAKKFIQPMKDEGYDRLYRVRIEGDYLVEELP
jgi:predicted kinase